MHLVPKKCLGVSGLAANFKRRRLNRNGGKLADAGKNSASGFKGCYGTLEGVGKSRSLTMGSMGFFE